MDVRALIFDVNGTLVDIETDEGMEEIYRAIGHFLTYQGISLHRWEVRDLYFNTMKEHFVESKEVYPEFDVVEVWRKILERHAVGYTRSLPGGKLEQLPLFIAEVQRGISRKKLRAFPQVKEVLETLKNNYQLAIVSDAQSPYAVPELRAAGISEYFDPIIISGDYGYRKPDVRLFHKALERLKARPDQAIFIGNDLFRDIYGAKQSGMKTILFNGGRGNDRIHNTVPDYIIHNISELPKSLQYFVKI